jgi:outer membrane protein assembly factor BamB
VGGSRDLGGSRTLYLAKYDPAGTLLWSTDAFPESSLPGEVRAMVIDRTGDVFVTGGETPDGTHSSVIAARYSGTDGRLLWRSPVSPPSAGGGVLEGVGEALALGSTGQVAVGGYVRTESGASGVVCRLDPTTGAPLWHWSAADTTIRDLVFDRRGDLFATGTFLVAVKLQGGTGAQSWRVASPAASAQGLGYPQMRTLVLDPKGEVTVGGSLRNTLDDTRAFYVARLQCATGQFVWESAGPAQYSFETPMRLFAVGSDVVAAGRYRGNPGAMRLRAKEGSLRWLRQPWQANDRPDEAAGVADLAGDGSRLFTLGTDFPDHLLLSAFSEAGRPLWRQDYGPGQGVRLAPAARGRLYVIGQQPAAEGASWGSVLLGLDGRTGRHLEN